MNRYNISGYTTMSVWTEVLAENEEEAREKAYDKIDVSLCHYCSRHLESDGEVEITAVELDEENADGAEEDE